MSDRKRERLALTAEIGARLAVLSDPAVVKWFDLTASNLAAAVVDATNDDDRRETAAYARAFRDLRHFLYGAIDAGERARRDMDEVKRHG